MQKNYKINLTTQQKQIFDILLTFRKQQKLNTVIRVAGGWVRDKIMGKQSQDIDIALDDMKGQTFAHLMSDYFALKGQKQKFGVIASNPDLSKHLQTATLQIKNQWIDLVNLRSQTYNQLTRVPQIKIGTPTEDAERRDLTINSLFYNLITQQVEDWTGKGLEDIQNGIIRTPLQPFITFKDDPLRILRVIRFAGRFNFKIVEQIFVAMQNNQVREALKTKVSKQRIGKQLMGVLKSPYLLVSFELIRQNNLWNIVFEIGQNSNFQKQKFNSIGQISVDTLKRCIQNLSKFNPTVIRKYIKNQLSNEQQKKQNIIHYTQQQLKSYLYIASLTFIYTQYSVIKKKNKQSLIEYVIKQSLKLPNKASKFAQLTNKGALDLLNLVQNQPVSLIKIIKWLKNINQKWQMSILIALSFNPNKSQQINQIYQQIIKNKFQQIYLLPAFIDGTYVTSVLKKKGENVKYILENSKIWRILNPEKSKQQFLQTLQQNIDYFSNPNSYT